MTGRSRLLTALAACGVLGASRVVLGQAFVSEPGAARFIPGDTSDVGLETNFGFFEATDGHTFTWICPAALHSTVGFDHPKILRNRDGVFLLASRFGNSSPVLYRSSDGCDWDPVLTATAYDVAWDETTSLKAVAAAGTNGIFLSDDAGLTWHTVFAGTNGEGFSSVRVSDADPSFMYATSSTYVPGTFLSATVYESSNGGLDWIGHPSTFMVNSNLAPVDVVATSPVDPRVLYLRDDFRDLLLSTNAGASVQLVTNPLWVREGTAAFELSGAGWAAEYHDTVRAPDGASFSPLPGGPHARAVARDPRGIFVTGDEGIDGFTLALSSNGGVSFRPVFEYHQISGVRSCPAGTMVHAVCTQAKFDDMLAFIGVTPVPSPTSNPDAGSSSGCGCSLATGETPARAFPALFVVVAALATRRRRVDR
jgi:MYXO-CTERM domain-containing protein